MRALQHPSNPGNNGFSDLSLCNHKGIPVLEQARNIEASQIFADRGYDSRNQIDYI